MTAELKQWMIAGALAIILHAGVFCSVSALERVNEEAVVSYTVDLTTFQGPPAALKLLPVKQVPPPIKQALPDKKPPLAMVKKKDQPKAMQPRSIVQPVIEPTVNTEKEAVSQPIQQAVVAPLTSGSDIARGSGQRVVDQEKAAYYQLILSRLNKLKQYPSEARRRGEQGTVRLSFLLNEDGDLIEHQIVASSGSPTLDRAVERLISRATPFPPIPESIGTNRLELIVPVTFTLN